ncbi:MAG: M48 family metalloprotease [Oscillochloris sp.]|nr:M48 family metalloprotease [Oscillochloris sp.]
MGIVLYLITLLIESLSIMMRGVLVAGLAGLLLEPNVALILGAIAAFSPLLSSFLVLAGIPSGHMLVRQSLGARLPTADERRALEAGFARARTAGVPVPTRVFTIDEDALNAAISGRTLYVYRKLYDSPYLPGVLAHELGHYNSLDGRLMLALRALTMPGGFLIMYITLSLLRWIAYGMASVLAAFLIVFAAIFRMNLSRLVAMLFRGSIQLLRLTIILALGGVGPALLGSIWRSHFLRREFAADAYARRLGYGELLASFFEHEVLDDVRIPWYNQPTHPPATQRVRALRRSETMEPPPINSTPGWIPLLIVLALAGILVGSSAIFWPRRYHPNDRFTPTPGPTPTLGI